MTDSGITAALEIEKWLREDGQLDAGPARLTPLTGGVSCEILKVEQGDRKFVVKRALAKLRVASEWLADVSRNAVEFDFFWTMKDALAGSIPQALFHNPDRGYFTMEYLEEGWSNWKELLLAGNIDPAHGILAGTLMGKLHSHSWQDQGLAKTFDTLENFRQLRMDPYLRTAAKFRPEVREELLKEADRIESCHLCLIHGDFSPKNLLLKGSRMVLLDAEVANFGDPSFDVAFLQTHLFLKGLYCAPKSVIWEETAKSAWDSYCEIMGDRMNETLEKHCAHLLAALMLARVDGKSPVEYLPAPKQDLTRRFAISMLLEKPSTMQAMRTNWSHYLSNFS